MTVTIGIGLVVLAGLFQGSFVLPMTMTRGWKWEHTWGAFSLLGMLVFNWAIGFALLPGLMEAIRVTPRQDIYALLILGACWGTGAILFGLGIERLGMAVGYPVIMGLILSLGALIPLLQSGVAKVATKPGLVLVAGTAVVLLGILLCSRASGQKNQINRESAPSSTGSGIVLAVFAGILSCLPNVGLSNAAGLADSATRLGASPEMARNAGWVVQFSAGFAVNFVYCAILTASRRNQASLSLHWAQNLGLAAAMGLMWIGSFWLYGLGAARMGRWGEILGWPLFISVSIVMGNLWGIWRGEWRSAALPARAQLNRGLIVMLIAVVLFGIGGAVR